MSEILRTTFLPDDIRGGTKLFLMFYENRRLPYVVETRFEIIKRFKCVYDAGRYFDHFTLFGDEQKVG